MTPDPVDAVIAIRGQRAILRALDGSELSHRGKHGPETVSITCECGWLSMELFYTCPGGLWCGFEKGRVCLFGLVQLRIQGTIFT